MGVALACVLSILLERLAVMTDGLDRHKFPFALCADGEIAGRGDVTCLVITVCLGVLL